jgi:hypothetical protein
MTQPVDNESITFLSGGWAYGLCFGSLTGCAWAQNVKNVHTWRHFSTLAEAKAYAEEKSAGDVVTHYQLGGSK